MDALNGICFVDDAQCVEFKRCRKFKSDQNKIVIKIEEVKKMWKINPDGTATKDMGDFGEEVINITRYGTRFYLNKKINTIKRYKEYCSEGLENTPPFFTSKEKAVNFIAKLVEKLNKEESAEN